LQGALARRILPHYDVSSSHHTHASQATDRTTDARWRFPRAVERREGGSERWSERRNKRRSVGDRQEERGCTAYVYTRVSLRIHAD
jgi:hypothetical protein